MTTIDINKEQNVKFITFPDGQPHASIPNELHYVSEVNVICAIRSPTDLLKLLEVSNALDDCSIPKVSLWIPYLMGARSDRVMLPGDSFDLRVIADMINYCKFEAVYIFDVHSEAALLLINNSCNINNRRLVETYLTTNSILICPDAGAVKKVDNYLNWNPAFNDVAYCIKKRDLANKGKVNLTVLEPEKCINKPCIIIDDICDGGATFNAIASQINPSKLTLMVSHGIFSKGLGELEKNFDSIITTDSFCRKELWQSSTKLEVHSVDDLIKYTLHTNV